MACRTCRIRKIRCDQTRPVCKNCALRHAYCTYAGERRMRRNRRPGAVASRASLLIAPATRRSATRSPKTNGRDPSVPTNADGPQLSIFSGSQPCIAQSVESIPTVSHMPGTSKNDTSTCLLDRILQGDDINQLYGTYPALLMRTDCGDEYTGPSSGVFSISDVGLNWIKSQIPDANKLCDTVRDIRNTLLSNLIRPKCIPTTLTPFRSCRGSDFISYPKVEEYVQAYFSTIQEIFPVLDRTNFEHQLATFGSDLADSQPSSWKALFSAVLASGCRAALSHETSDAFQESGRASWKYFQIALSCQSDIIHGGTDLIAVQAFAVMTIYAQGLSSPQRLEFTLCSIASRLAQSIGLNRHSSPDWDLGESEKLERNRTFWVIYCLDKTIALRCGRFSAIHDDEISCSFPKAKEPLSKSDVGTSTTNRDTGFDTFLSFTQLARICGSVSHGLYSVTALYSSPCQLSTVLSKLLRDLETWKNQIPVHLQPGKPFGRVDNSLEISRFQLLVLHSSYHYVRCAIYRRFMPLFLDNQHLSVSFKEHAKAQNIEAARAIVLLTKHTDIESFTPGWLVFYYPFMALTTIFVHIACNPASESKHRDIALMEVTVGFFGRLEYITSGEAAFTKASQFVTQARQITSQQADKCSDSHLSESPHDVTVERSIVNNSQPSKEVECVGQGSVSGEASGIDRNNLSSDADLSLLVSSSEGSCFNLGRQLQFNPDPADGTHFADTGQIELDDGPSSHAMFSDVISLLDDTTVGVDDETSLEQWILGNEVPN